MKKALAVAGVVAVVTGLVLWLKKPNAQEEPPQEQQEREGPYIATSRKAG